MNNKDNAVALITGASSGIGLVTAQALQRAGYRVFGTSRKAAASTDGITMLSCDVTNEASVNTMVAEVLQQAARIDLLVNNAGDAPEVVADTVVKAATAAVPKRLYTAGKQASQVRFLRRFMPEALVDKSLRKINQLPIV
ncbi:SDR family NAD(P)-dependent oxidoreductase [Methylomonas fluvii]|uniref:SDR family NAD(P)-dependent oxidoreductase n=1 Tax=Methylomonas fluvii TaxID=1854564 RepID=A0ABR9DAD0_9GAMM|nr:SDR family NAD(P)-dependent oxidoreductase [Methylomonas fluvii]MBD9360065.1 SDR family NAD(P)-dependent oxidoreductase [Methylomonas fluvii]